MKQAQRPSRVRAAESPRGHDAPPLTRAAPVMDSPRTRLARNPPPSTDALAPEASLRLPALQIARHSVDAFLCTVEGSGGALTQQQRDDVLLLAGAPGVLWGGARVLRDLPAPDEFGFLGASTEAVVPSNEQPCQLSQVLLACSPHRDPLAPNTKKLKDAELAVLGHALMMAFAGCIDSTVSDDEEHRLSAERLADAVAAASAAAKSADGDAISSTFVRECAPDVLRMLLRRVVVFLVDARGSAGRAQARARFDYDAYRSRVISECNRARSGDASGGPLSVPWDLMTTRCDVDRILAAMRCSSTPRRRHAETIKFHRSHQKLVHVDAAVVPGDWSADARAELSRFCDALAGICVLVYGESPVGTVNGLLVGAFELLAAAGYIGVNEGAQLSALLGQRSSGSAVTRTLKALPGHTRFVCAIVSVAFDRAIAVTRLSREHERAQRTAAEAVGLSGLMPYCTVCRSICTPVCGGMPIVSNGEAKADAAPKEKKGTRTSNFRYSKGSSPPGTCINTAVTMGMEHVCGARPRSTSNTPVRTSTAGVACNATPLASVGTVGQLVRMGADGRYTSCPSCGLLFRVIGNGICLLHIPSGLFMCSTCSTKRVARRGIARGPHTRQVLNPYNMIGRERLHAPWLVACRVHGEWMPATRALLSLASDIERHGWPCHLITPPAYFRSATLANAPLMQCASCEADRADRPAGAQHMPWHLLRPLE